MVYHDRTAIAVSVIGAGLWCLCVTVWLLWRRQRRNEAEFSSRIDSVIWQLSKSFDGLEFISKKLSREQSELIQGMVGWDQNFRIVEQEREAFEESITAIEKRMDRQDAMHAALARGVSEITVTSDKSEQAIYTRIEAVEAKFITPAPTESRTAPPDRRSARAWSSHKLEATLGEAAALNK